MPLPSANRKLTAVIVIMFDSIIKDKANSHQAPVPPDAWNNIVQQKKKRRFVFFWWSSIALLLFTVASTAYLVGKEKPDASFTAAISELPSITENNSAAPGALQPVVSSTTDSTQPTTSAGAVNNTATKDLASTEAAADPQTKTTAAKMSATAEQALPGTYDDPVAGKPSSKTKISQALTAAYKRRKKNTKAITWSQNNDEEPEEIVAAEKNSNPVGEPAALDRIQVRVLEIAAPKTAIATTPHSKITEPAVPKQATAITQDKKKKTDHPNQPGKQHWFVDAGVTPLLPLQQYDKAVSFDRTSFSNNNLRVFSANLVNSSIENSMAFSIAIRRQLNQKIMIGLGLQYLLLKENIQVSGHETNTQYNLVQRLENGPTGPVLINDTVLTVTEGTRSITATNSYHLYSVPVFIQYNWVQKRSWTLSAVGGVFVNISSSYHNEINRNAAALLITNPAVEGKSNIGYDLFAGLRFGKTAGSKVEFFAMPCMRWNLDQFYIKNSFLRKTINQAGLSVGISYKIK